MEISFKNQTLKRICEDEDFALQKYSSDTVASLLNRLNDLRAAKRIDDVPSIFFEMSNKTQNKVLFLTDKSQLVFESGHIVPIKNEQDWSTVYRVRITKIQELA